MLTLTLCSIYAVAVLGGVLRQTALDVDASSQTCRNVSNALFEELEEHARIVDISYCVGTYGAGIEKPFECASHCSKFKHFELVSTWSTGQMLSDSCGYIALSHPPSPPRIILAFRGTYSMANTIADLSTIPQDYIPYPGDEEDHARLENKMLRRDVDPSTAKCSNCSVHSGFMRSWRNTKPEVLPHVEQLIERFPSYQLTLVGHSLGGAVAALAALDFHAKGWTPQVTTFGEPRIGNQQLAQYLDKAFKIDSSAVTDAFRRVTHIDDPVPLLPLTEWGYHPHAGEVYISKSELPPEVQDLQLCKGDGDPECLTGADGLTKSVNFLLTEPQLDVDGFWDWWKETKGSLSIPTRWKLWQLFFAHRDYFWRLGLCVPWTEPKEWRYWELLNGDDSPNEL